MNTKKENSVTEQAKARKHLESANRLEDHMVVTQKEGIMLGDVSNLYIDPASGKVTALEIRKGIWSEKKYVDVKDILFVGENIIFVNSEKSIISYENFDKNTFRNIDSLKGLEVTTLGGRKVGELDDVDISINNFSVCEISLNEKGSIPVKMDEITIGEDEILIPTEYESRLVPREEDKNTSYGKTILNHLSKSFNLEKNKSSSIKSKSQPRQ